MISIGKIIFIIGIPVLLCSCNQNEVKDNETTKEGNVSTTISTDINKLGKLIDLSGYTPSKVKFKYVFVDNSGQDHRLSVPGPSDSYLEAVLYFDEETFERLTMDHMKLSTITLEKKENYQFDWLDNDIKKELELRDSLWRDFPSTFFNSEGLHKGGFYLLHNKILLRLYSN